MQNLCVVARINAAIVACVMYLSSCYEAVPRLETPFEESVEADATGMRLLSTYARISVGT